MRPAAALLRSGAAATLLRNEAGRVAVDEPEVEHVQTVARGIATAVAPESGLEPVQASLLGAITDALNGVEIDYYDLDPLGPEDLAAALTDRSIDYRRRIVHHMVLGELVLKPLPASVARRVAGYADALGVADQFVRIARRYAQGAFGLAWLDLHRSGFAEHWETARTDQLKSDVKLPDQLSLGEPDPDLARRWAAFERLPPGTLGRGVWEMYHGRGFALPGSPGGASAFLAQHDFVHVVADYGTNLNGELEVFALIGRADPDPKGFAWLATLVGLFETGYVADAGFFVGDTGERHLDRTEMHVRLADALRRGAAACDAVGVDLLEIDYHEMATLPVAEVRSKLGIPDKSPKAVASGSPGIFDVEGMSRLQQEYVASHGTGG
jgi:hypothetical protein